MTKYTIDWILVLVNEKDWKRYIDNYIDVEKFSDWKQYDITFYKNEVEKIWFQINLSINKEKNIAGKVKKHGMLESTLWINEDKNWQKYLKAKFEDGGVLIIRKISKRWDKERRRFTYIENVKKDEHVEDEYF